jgi:hypothetical protein
LLTGFLSVLKTILSAKKAAADKCNSEHAEMTITKSERA